MSLLETGLSTGAVSLAGSWGLSVYAQASGLEVRCFQDAKGDEVDAVLVTGTSWAGLEVKLSAIPAVAEAAGTRCWARPTRMAAAPKTWKPGPARSGPGGGGQGAWCGFDERP
jgi:hypothetical protein